MRVYADEVIYTTQYRLSNTVLIPSAEFQFYARKASAILDRYTLGKIPDEVPECVSLCCCELSELLYNKELMRKESNGAASAKVGDLSVTYKTESAAEREKGFNAEVKRIVYDWLSDSGLLYRGAGYAV